MNRTAFASVLLLLCMTRYARADLQALEMEAYGQMKDVMPAAQALVVDGRADEANQRLLAVFPEKTRTPAQSLLLGNLIFKQDAKISYQLHKTAAAALPNEPDAQLEWAMEQHRAGEYTGAADAYSTVSAADPDNALVYGLWAECLIRTGKIDEAVKTWQRSERAGKGSLEALESDVCEVNGHLFPDAERVVLMKKARAGDIQSAGQLIGLDTAFPQDWWNRSPRETYLRRDLEMLHLTKFADPARLNELLCAAECGISVATETGDGKAILTRHGFLFDKANTFPADGAAMSIMLLAAMSQDAVSKTEATDKWAARILAAAQKSHDAEYINCAAHFYEGTDQLASIDQLGWDNTGDPRFAASLLAGMDAKGTLKAGDPLLVKALKQFPEDSMVAVFDVQTAARAKLPMRDVLVHAIKCEYSQFSLQRGLESRRGALALQGYFKALADAK